MENTGLQPKARTSVQSKGLKYTDLPSVNTLGNTTESISISETWERVLGKEISVITEEDFVKISSIIDIPRWDNDNEDTRGLRLILPYITQRIKMWGARVLFPENLSQFGSQDKSQSATNLPIKPNFKMTLLSKPMITKRQGSCTGIEEVKPSNAAINRLDVITVLFNVMHPLVAIDIAKILSQFPVSLPLIIPIISDGKEMHFQLLLPYLQTCSFKWEAKPGIMVENRLFVDPYKLVACIRVGDNRIGKNAILNELLKNKTTFSSYSEPGALQGKPNSLLGTVEFTPLTKETCENGLWLSFVKDHYSEGPQSDTILLLANLHGDSTEHTEHIQVLKYLGASFVLFVMPENDPEVLNANMENLISKTGDEDNMCYVIVDNIWEHLENPEITINSTQRNEGITHEKMWKIFKNAFASAELKRNFRYGLSTSTTIQFAPRLETNESINLVDFITNKGCQASKKMLVLQLEQKNDKNLYINFWETQKELKVMLDHFSKILLLPKESRKIGMHHIDQQISLLSKKETSIAFEELLRLKESLNRNIGMDDENQTRFKQLQADILAKLDEINKMSLGMEHLFREAGRCFELNECLTDFSMTFSPLSYAELLLEGHSIELLDGDLGCINSCWINAICHEVCKLKKGLRVFVISILGLQSSGKSTLLNALFACKFAVSVGRCTRGLYMRLLMLEDKLKEKFKCDAFLLIDTEGLGAPEKMNDPHSEKKDRQMATFAMSISNLTLVNAVGESVRDLTEILQIVVVTLARLEQADISPDILLVQHLPERNQNKSASGVEEFCNALRMAIETTVKEDMALGVQNSKTLKTLLERVQKDEIRIVFRPFKQGASANAPPSEEYHEDVIDLYEKILKLCFSKNSEDFHKWHYRLDNFFNAVSSQNFSLRFKNIKDMQEFIEIGQEIAGVKEHIDSAFKSHRENLESRVVRQISNASPDLYIRNELPYIESELKKVVNECSCDNCKNACDKRTHFLTIVEGKSFEVETTQTIELYWNSGYQNACHMITQFAKQHSVTIGLKDSINGIIKSTLQEHLNNDETKSRFERSNTLVPKIWLQIRKQVENNVGRVKYPIADIWFDINEAYPEVQITQNCNTFALRGTKIFDTSKSSTIISKFITSKELAKNDVEYIRGQLISACTKSFKESQAQYYERGMVAKLKNQINSQIGSLEEQLGITLEGSSKWICHTFAANIFFKFVTAIQAEWDNKINPINVLKNEETHYLKQIEIRLQNGFTVSSEGLVMGHFLEEAIQKKAEKRGTVKWMDTAMDLTWIRNTSNVRLKYFSELAQKVQIGENRDALQYFQKPEATITNWFIAEVDKTDNTKALDVANLTFREELGKVIQDIRNIGSFVEAIDYIERYTSEFTEMCFDSSLRNGNLSEEDFKYFCENIEKYLSSISNPQSAMNLKLPSTQLINRLGCTKCCYWCGSLCWGAKGHETDVGGTGKHHSCHQPRGLRGTNEGSKRLVARSCDTVKDKDMLIWKEKFLPWADVKSEKMFLEWKFDEHSKKEFCVLMRWFFYRLNSSLAAVYCLEPASDKAIGDHIPEVYTIDVNKLLAQISAEVN